ncbi:hypothetical protein [Streptomyces viridosporus]|uniref:hypothetical protein n=1 Tax=Streptomyces viridosporus TaxID=67581 RepID=UPI0033257F3A
MAVIRTEALEQGAEADAGSLKRVESDELVEPDDPVEPVVPLEPAVPPVESPEAQPAGSVCPAPVGVSPLVPGEDVGADADAEPAGAPSSWTPSPLLHAVSVSAAAVNAAATNTRVRRVRWVRVDM